MIPISRDPVLPAARGLLRRFLRLLALGLGFAVCWHAAEIRPWVLFDAGSLAAIGRFVGGLFPPDLSPSFLGTVLTACWQTLAIAVAGTALSIALGLPLGVLAAATLWRRGILVAAERPRTASRLLALLSRAARALLGLLRAIPDLMWALLFVVAVGLGPTAGTLALAVAYCGVLGRVYADLFDEVDRRPVEALHATGATPGQVFLRGIWPQAAPQVTAYTLYSFECCVRAASVLGFIGAGGIGYEIHLSMRLFRYDQVLTLIGAFLVLVGVTDTVSRFLRRRLHAAAPAGLLAHARDKRGWAVPPLTAKQALPIGLFVLAAGFYGSGLFSGRLLDAQLPGRMARFAASLVPPDLGTEFLQSLAEPLLQTVGISVMGTWIGVTLALFLLLPATSTLVLTEEDAAGQRSWASRLTRGGVYHSARLLLGALRSIPELVWVLICVLAVGLGAFAGTLAIGLHTGGVLGKLFAEALEEAPRGPVDALRAAGARPLQILLWGMWPQARPVLISYTVLRWETNLRVSTVLGLVGGGGLGQAIYTNIQLGFYSRVTTLIVLVYLLVIACDWISDRWRARPGLAGVA